MTIRNLGAAAFLFGFLVTVLVGLPPDEKGLAIVREADRRDTGFGDNTSELQMILRNRRGDESVRELRFRVLEMTDDGDKSLVIFDNPRDVKGTALLTFTHRKGEDDQWLYLPALKRVKRISSSNKSGSFMGSEFAYEDMRSQEVGKYSYRWLREEPCPGEEYGSLICNVIECFPVEKNSGYNQEVRWIDQEDYRVIKIDYYDRKNSPLKTLTLMRYQQHLDQFWRAEEMLMTNHQTGKSTLLIWKNYHFRTGLDEHDFTKESLQRVR